MLRLSCILFISPAFTSSTTASPIARVITLMMENHSFDNMLGWLEGVGDLDGSEFNHLDPSDPKSSKVMVGKGAPFCMDHDPGHGFSDTTQQIFGRKDDTQEITMDGFVHSFRARNGTAQNIMDCYTPDQVPVISALATQYTVATQYFPSFPGPTGPNRMFMHTATTRGYDGSKYDGYGLEARSIYEDLLLENRTFEIRWQDFTTAHGITPLESMEQVVKDVGFEGFLEKLATGTGLADYTVLVPSLGPIKGVAPNSQHPKYDIRPGEALMKQVYEALRASAYWEDTLLVVTYDEHGGFWDKAPPPTGVANPCPVCTAHPDPFAFDRLGVRIPTVFISRWSEKKVDRTQYEGASVPATVRAIFNLTAPPLNARMAAAKTFDNWLETPRADTDCPTTLPDVAQGPDCSPRDPMLTDLGEEMAEMYVHLAHRRLKGTTLERLLKQYAEITCDEEAGRFNSAVVEAMHQDLLLD